MTISTFVLLAASTPTAHIGWRRGGRPLAVGAGAFALLPGWAVIREAHPLVVTGLLAVVAAIGWQRWGRSSSIVARWGGRSRRKSGVASWLDIPRHRSGPAMRRRAGVLRPSLRTAGFWARVRQLRTLPVTEVAVRLCRTGRVWVWADLAADLLRRHLGRTAAALTRADPAETEGVRDTGDLATGGS